MTPHLAHRDATVPNGRRPTGAIRAIRLVTPAFAVSIAAIVTIAGTPEAAFAAPDQPLARFDLLVCLRRIDPFKKAHCPRSPRIFSA